MLALHARLIGTDGPPTTTWETNPTILGSSAGSNAGTVALRVHPSFTHGKTCEKNYHFDLFPEYLCVHFQMFAGNSQETPRLRLVDIAMLRLIEWA